MDKISKKIFFQKFLLFIEWHTHSLSLSLSLYIYIYIYIFIARKTYRFRETVGMFIVKKNVNDGFRLALIKLLTPEKKIF